MKFKGPHWSGKITALHVKDEIVSVTIQTDHAGVIVVSIPEEKYRAFPVRIMEDYDLRMTFEGLDELLDEKQRKQLKEGFVLDAPFTKVPCDKMSVDLYLFAGSKMLNGLKVEWWSEKETKKDENEDRV